MYPDWFLGAEFFLFGLIFGSFLNVCVYRLPRGLSVVSPRSACPECHTPIASFDNIPVLSWLILRGRCRHCKVRITPRYAVVELVCGLLFLLSFTRAGLSAETLKGCVLAFLLLGLTFTDAETHLLPDAMTLSGVGMGLIFSIFSLVPGPAYDLFPVRIRESSIFSELNVQLGLRSFANSLLGIAIGSGTLYVIAWIYKKLRKVDGLGFGDIKLMAMVGAFLGPALTLFVLCTASLVGGTFGVLILISVFRKRYLRYRTRLGAQATSRSWRAANIALRCLEIPFGVFLCVMSIAAWFYGPQIIHSYLLFFLMGS